MIVLDTTVLIYSVGARHEYREPCIAILDAIRSGRLAATTTIEVIQEFAHVRARRHGRENAAKLATSMASILSPLRECDRGHLDDGLELWRRHDRIGAFDSVLAAVALDTKHATIVSADRGFAGIEGLHHVFPDTRGMSDLLGDEIGQ